MNLLDLLATRPVSRFYQHLQPKGTHTRLFDPATDTAETYLQALSTEDLTSQELLTAARELYVWRYPWWRGLGNGFATATDVPPWDGRFALWVLGVLGPGGWAILEIFEADPVALLQELLTWWSPRLWMDQAALLRLPPAVLGLLKDDQLEVGSVRHIDLRWLPRHMACGLTLRGPIVQAQLPIHLQCRGFIHLVGVGGIEQVVGLESPDHGIRLANMPDLGRIRVCCGTGHVVEACPQLRVVEGYLDRALVLRNLPMLEVVAVQAPDLAGRAADLTLENCPRLSRIHWPNGPWRWVRDLTIVDCPRLEELPSRLRATGTITGTGCPALMGRGIPNEER